MDVAEDSGQQALFNVLARARDQAGHVPTSKLDASYRLTDKFMGSVIGNILDRGHSIGLHGSYNSYANATQVSLEMDQLRNALDKAGSSTDKLPTRQHYLRWAPQTWRHLAAAGASFDTTIGYAEAPGFRSGTCRPHSVFDIDSRVPLPLLERPLIIMDVSLESTPLQRGAIEPVLAQVEGILFACRRMGGELVLLWHNNNTAGRRGRVLYRELVRLLTSGAHS